MIREAKQTDLPELITLVVEALKSDSYPQLVIDQNKVFVQLSGCVISKQHFAWVSEHEGKLVGGLGAVVSPQFVYEGKQATVLMWYCRDSGDGLKLMKQFMKWLKDKPNVNLIEYSLPQKRREKMIRIMKRFGFNTEVPAMCLLR